MIKRVIGCLKKDGKVIRVCSTQDVDSVLEFLDEANTRRDVYVYTGDKGLPCLLKCGNVEIKFCWIVSVV